MVLGALPAGHPVPAAELESLSHCTAGILLTALLHYRAGFGKRIRDMSNSWCFLE